MEQALLEVESEAELISLETEYIFLVADKAAEQQRILDLEAKSAKAWMSKKAKLKEEVTGVIEGKKKGEEVMDGVIKAALSAAVAAGKNRGGQAREAEEQGREGEDKHNGFDARAGGGQGRGLTRDHREGHGRGP
ncbi:hypothetical protein TrLO_g15063 [Triparma laevis f. longispina]|uniref:Uncharacterized protein n=1 Tax=Triparma laevis f. longispina TaxID=1714387 RepID=A0A9W7FTZ3_9STRA|nr:hypothetical protein TrLO_g15063 [Triparma laevis f. longispina]